MEIIRKFGGIYKGISYQIMKQVYLLWARPIFDYTSPVLYHKLTG